MTPLPDHLDELAILSAVREDDVPARFGGEEFVVLLRDPAPGVAVEVGERIRALHRGPGAPVVTRLIERQTGFPPESTDDTGDWLLPMTDQSRLS